MSSVADASGHIAHYLNKWFAEKRAGAYSRVSIAQIVGDMQIF